MNQEGTPGVEGVPNFRSLVEGLLKESDLFPTSQPRATLLAEHTDEEKRAMKDEKTAVLTAIENNDLTSFVAAKFGGEPNDTVMDAIRCLTAIYDELKKAEPDENFVRETVEQLKEYL